MYTSPFKAEQVTYYTNHRLQVQIQILLPPEHPLVWIQAPLGAVIECEMVLPISMIQKTKCSYVKHNKASLAILC
jgi:hypothetical protein